MSNIYLVYDQYGNITIAQDTYPQVTPPAQLLVADDTTPNATAALAQRQDYMVQNGQIIPAVTIGIDRTHVVNGVWDTYTLTLTASDAAAHDVNLNIGGYAATVSVPASGSATFEAAIHQSVTSQQVTVLATGTGMITHETFIGGNTIGGTTLQTYTDANGHLHIAPTSKAYLEGFYALNGATVQKYLADIGTAINMLNDVSYRKLFAGLRVLYNLYEWATKLPSNPYVPTAQDTTDIGNVQFNADEANAESDIVANVLPKLYTTLNNAFPNGGAEQLQYKNYVGDLATTFNNFEAYMNDLQAIPNLV